MEFPVSQWFLVTLYLIGALATAPLLYRTVPRHKSQGGTALLFLIFGLGLWVFTAAMQLAAPPLSVKLYFAKLSVIAYAIVPIAWTIFVIEYTNFDLPNKLSVYTGLGITGLLHNILASTNELHNLYWSETPTLIQDPFPLLSTSYAPLYYCFAAFYASIALFGIYRLFIYSLDRGLTYEAHARILGVGTSVLLITQAVSLTNVTPYNGLLDVTGIGIVTAQASLLVAIYKFDLLELAPSERDQLLYEQEGLEEANELLEQDDIDLPNVSIGALAEKSAEKFYDTHDYTTDEVTISVDCALSTPASEELLERFFTSLYENSAEHNELPVEIHVSDLVFDSGFVVEDNGSGIRDDFKKHAFDPGTTSKANSSGTGLAVIKRIAHAHNWNIKLVDSAEGGVRYEITNVESTPSVTHG